MSMVQDGRARGPEYHTANDFDVVLDPSSDEDAVAGMPTVTVSALDTQVQPVLVTPARAATPAPRPGPRRAAGWVGRTARRAVAAALLLVALWFWAVPFFFPVTSRAVVNARLVQVRAPISGEIAGLNVGVGDEVTAGEPVVRVAGRNVDLSHLTTLRGKHAELTARRARLTLDAAATTAAEATCRADLERYRQAVVENLRAVTLEGQAKVKMAEVEARGADRRYEEKRALATQNVVGAGEKDDNRDAAAVAKAKIDLEQASLGRSAKELEAADHGVYVTRDAPLFELQARELALKIPRLNAELRETEHLLAAAGDALREEEERVGRLSETAVPAPVTGVVWKRAGNLAQVVERNEAVVDVADGNTVFVEALLHQRYSGSVVVGSRAVVNLTGGATLSGHVRAVRTPNADEVEPGYALSLTDRDIKQLKVVIELHTPAPATLVGRHARVLMTAADPGPVERGVAWLFTRLRF